MADRISTRRDLLTGFPAVGSPPETSNQHSRSETPVNPADFSAGSTVRMATRAMACEFSAILNPGPASAHYLALAGDALQVIHEIESWLSIYREHSEISRVNQSAALDPQIVRRPLMDLLKQSQQISYRTDRAFDITSGALLKLWRSRRKEQTIPTAQEIESTLEQTGAQHLLLDEDQGTVRFAVPELQLDPGAIGKGYALDQAVTALQQNDAAPKDFLLHGGHSSLVARGCHQGRPGWPVGVGNPLFTKKRLGLLLLCDQAMSTSGSNIQFFRHEGRRYGHILDPRSGWPAEGMLSVTVLAESAAVADAVSTAFFVLGVEKATQCCENIENIGVILVPFPEQGRRVEPRVIGISPDRILWDPEQVVVRT